jgi:hypothetical protein
MNPRYERSDLPDQVLSSHLPVHLARERTAMADHLADLGEYDTRRLYLSEGYSSMYDFCVGRLGLTREAAFKRIRAARIARQFPILFDAVADGRLHLSAIVAMASYLTAANVDDLVAAVRGKSRYEIERYLAWHACQANRVPDPQVPPGTPVTQDSAQSRLSPGTVEMLDPQPQRSPRTVETQGSQPQLSPGTVETCGTPAPTLVMANPSPPRDQVTVRIEDIPLQKLRYLQELLGHQTWSREVVRVLERALEAYIREVEKRKFAATDRPRRSGGSATHGRHIPAEVKREVWVRDGGRCTFVSDSGHRCESRSPIEFDHIDSRARGGPSTVSNLRLRCRAHNQFTAEQEFGREFMEHKRLTQRMPRRTVA